MNASVPFVFYDLRKYKKSASSDWNDIDGDCQRAHSHVTFVWLVFYHISAAITTSGDDFNYTYLLEKT